MNLLIQKPAEVKKLTEATSAKPADYAFGRGLNHRRLDPYQRAHLVAQVVSGERPFIPCQREACYLFGVPTLLLREHLKARRQFAAQQEAEAISGGDGNGNGAVTLADSTSDKDRLTLVREHALRDLIEDLDLARGDVEQVLPGHNRIVSMEKHRARFVAATL
jgi:hypothetical protein